MSDRVTPKSHDSQTNRGVIWFDRCIKFSRIKPYGLESGTIIEQSPMRLSLKIQNVLANGPPTMQAQQGK
jgi:hypothetical protein